MVFNTPAKLENSIITYSNGKDAFSFQSQKEAIQRIFKLHRVGLILHSIGVLKILMDSNIVWAEHKMYKATDLEEVKRMLRSNCNICWIVKKTVDAENIYFSFITTLKPLVWIMVWRILWGWEYQIFCYSLSPVCRSRG